MKIIEWLKSRFARPKAPLSVRFNDWSVTAERPDGLFEAVAWRELQAIAFKRAVDSPFPGDACFVLTGSVRCCFVSVDSPEAEPAIGEISRLPT